MLYPDVLPFFKALKQMKRPSSHGDSAWSQPVVGVITNSDDRVPAILSSLGLRVGSWRHGMDSSRASFNAEDDINFVMMSYDVGSEKPASDMFDATKQMLPGQEWNLLHVGDDVQKDYYAAKRAGWEGLLLDRETPSSWQEDDVGPIPPPPRIKNLQELLARIG